jgi:hypothetical protein
MRISMTKTGKSEVSKSGGVSVAGGLIDTVIEISQERARIMEATRAALLRGDGAEALERARELTGVPLKKKATNQGHSCE